MVECRSEVGGTRVRRAGFKFSECDAVCDVRSFEGVGHTVVERVAEFFDVFPVRPIDLFSGVGFP